MADLKPITLARLTLDRCDLVNGQGACTATTPCGNSWFTCSSRCDFNRVCIDYWFSSCEVPATKAPLWGITGYLPEITSCAIQPTEIETGKSFSKRSSGRICFRDTPDCEISIGALVKRQKFIEGRRLTLFSGDCSMSDLCQFGQTDLIIEKVELETNEGGCVYCFRLKDVLNVTAKALVPSKTLTDFAGNPINLSIGLDLDGTPTENEPDADPNGKIGSQLFSTDLNNNANNAECLSEISHLCVADEVLRVRGNLDAPGGWNVVLMERASCGSTLGPRKRGTKVSIPKVYRDMHLVDVVCDLITNNPNIEQAVQLCCDGDAPRIIDWSSFEAYRCKNPLLQIRGEVIICKPEDSNALLNELAETFLFSLVYDNGVIRILDPCPPDEPEFIITADQIIKNSISLKNTDTYYTSVSYNHDTIDCTKKTDFENTAATTTFISADSLLDVCDRKEYQVPNQKVIDSRWIGPENRFLAAALARRWRKLRACPPQKARLQTLISDATALKFGSYGIVESDKLKNWDGSNAFWRLISRTYTHNDICAQLCFEQSPFNGTEKPCFSCADTIPSPAALS